MIHRSVRPTASLARTGSICVDSTDVSELRPNISMGCRAFASWTLFGSLAEYMCHWLQQSTSQDIWRLPLNDQCAMHLETMVDSQGWR